MGPCKMTQNGQVTVSPISCLLCGTGFPGENDLTFHYMTYTLLELAETLTKVTKEKVIPDKSLAPDLSDDMQISVKVVLQESEQAVTDDTEEMLEKKTSHVRVDHLRI